jgi:hypothetical protein
MIIERHASADLVRATLRGRLFQRLRREHGVSYNINVELQPRDATTNELVATIDGLAENQNELELGMLDALDSMATHPPNEVEIAAWHEEQVAWQDPTTLTFSILGQMAIEHLYGLELRAPDEILKMRQLVTAKDGFDAFVAASYSTLFSVPPNSTVVGARFPKVPEWSSPTVSGRWFKPVSPTETSRIVVGQQGIGRAIDADKMVAVKWSECAATLWWDDGGREVVATDGSAINLAPNLWQDYNALRTLIDQYAPRATRVPMGAPPQRREPPLPRSKAFGSTSTSTLIVLALCAAFFAALTAFNVWAFVITGIPALICVGFLIREVILRARKKRAGYARDIPRGRPFRHASHSTLWTIIFVCGFFTVCGVLADASGTNLGILTFAPVVGIIWAANELSRRSR